MSDTDEVSGTPPRLDDAKIVGAAAEVDELAREHARASLREKMFGREPERARIGRFLIIEKLGAGGMGVVYAAYDSELDRKIAIKLIRPQAKGADTAQQRLAREARALAKLSHPNVVQVYDVGTHDERVYIAMEFVDGETLGQWLERRGTRSHREILPMFLAAGRGLAAAHAAGLVHRDFKPANVLVGKDGTVRVVDFGLARQARADEGGTTPARDEPAAAASESQISRAGAVVGTPAYMSPEQHLGDPVDARTDQFSFCVALYEALYGQRPFAGDSLVQLSLAVTSGELARAPRQRNVPDWVRRVLMRGLSRMPEDRYASMEDLLTELAHDPAKRRRQIVAAAVLVAAIGGSIGLTSVLSEDPLAACSGGQARLVGVWDDDRKSEIEAALLATDLPIARDTWTRVESLLDAHTQAWSGQYVEACRATQSGEQSSEMLDLRMICLDRRLDEVEALVDVLADADADLVEPAIEAATHLPAVEQCADMQALVAEVRPPSNPTDANQVEAIRATLARASALEDAGKYDAALTVAEDASERAAAVEYAPVLAETLLHRGMLEFELGRFEMAEKSLSEAFYAGTESEHDRVAARAATWMVRLSGRLARYQDAERWARLGRAIINKLGDRGPQERAELLESEGESLDRQSKSDEAREKLVTALALREQTLGPNHPVVGGSLHRLGKVVFHQGEYAAAHDYFARALAIQEKSFGPEHPSLGRTLAGLGTALHKQGEFKHAREAYERSLAIQSKAFGPEHVAVARDLNNLGSLLRAQGDYEGARKNLERALAIRVAAFGPDHPGVAQASANLGNVFESLGQFDEARLAQQRALKIWEKNEGPEHRSVANTLSNLGVLARLTQDAAGAIDRHERALAIREKIQGADHPEVAYELTQLSKAQHLAGSDAQAATLAERAVTILEARGEKDKGMLSDARFALALALWARSSQRERALALARESRVGLRSGGPSYERDLAQLEAWLDERD